MLQIRVFGCQVYGTSLVRKKIKFIFYTKTTIFMTLGTFVPVTNPVSFCRKVLVSRPRLEMSPFSKDLLNKCIGLSDFGSGKGLLSRINFDKKISH